MSSSIGGAAGGDMQKVTYDPNDDGVIAVAETEATLYPDTGEQAFLDADHTKLNGVETGATLYPGAGEQAFLDADHTKLNGIETAATKYPDTGEQAFLDADHTKLNGVETAADVTDTTNVDAAGAVMESDIAAGCIRGRHGQSPFTYYNIAGTTDTFLMGNADTEWTTAGAGSARSVLNVADGADVTGSNPPQAHGASVHTDRTRSIFIPAGSSHYHSAQDALGKGLSFDGTTTEYAEFGGKMPRDFSSIGNIYMWFVGSSSAAGNVVFSFSSYYSADNETLTQHTGTDSNNVITLARWFRVRVNTVDLLANITVDDVFNLKVERLPAHASDTLTTDVFLTGIEIEYSSDM